MAHRPFRYCGAVSLEDVEGSGQDFFLSCPPLPGTSVHITCSKLPYEVGLFTGDGRQHRARRKTTRGGMLT